ncbi:MAG: type I-E CRISPR-associated protein Cse2/CasB [Chitinivibrionales bacterium]|nr:type I-E CRISPR-associated protein Cse2/CasB [Chitinivibrionales bacterium]
MMSEPRPKAPFSMGGAAMGAVLSWWNKLQTPEQRGARAALARCARPGEVVLEAGFHDLRRQIEDITPYSTDRLALVMGLVARVRYGHAENTLAVQMAQPKHGGERPVCSELRFRRLLKVPDQDVDALYTQLRRVVTLLDRSVHLPSLISGAYYWNENTRRRWAFDYYRHARLANS